MPGGRRVALCMSKPSVEFDFVAVDAEDLERGDYEEAFYRSIAKAITPQLLGRLSRAVASGSRDKAEEAVTEILKLVLDVTCKEIKP